MNKIYECLIIGFGPCGVGTAVKLKEAGVDVAIIEKSTPGGKINIAPRVDNYPHHKPISGPDLAVEFFMRANSAGIEYIGDEVTSLTKDDDIFTLVCQNNTYYAKTVVIASGTYERKLGLAKEEELFGHGLSYCAICDGHFFKNKDVAVIGGGNSALKEAIYLSDLVHKLYVIHRRNEFRGNLKLVNELKEKDNVEIITPYIPLEILGNDKVTGLIIQNRETEEKRTLNIDGLFPLVGQNPNTQFVKIPNVLNEWGTVPVNKSYETSCPNLFAGGDVLPRDIRQIYLAEHDGMMTANSVLLALGKK